MQHNKDNVYPAFASDSLAFTVAQTSTFTPKPHANCVYVLVCVCVCVCVSGTHSLAVPAVVYPPCLLYLLKQGTSLRTD